MRDHRKLHAFQAADKLALAVHQVTRRFPKEELFGLTSQMRRAATSTASNIVEGCARHSESDYLHFLDMAYGSARELEYQLSLAFRLGYLAESDRDSLQILSDDNCRLLNALIRWLRNNRTRAKGA
jgi:four helix bundle protein